MNTTVFSPQQIKFEFLSYIKEFDLDPGAWRIGMAADARVALFDENEVDAGKDVWLWKPALSAAAARIVYGFFVGRFGIGAAVQTPGPDANCVFLFRKA